MSDVRKDQPESERDVPDRAVHDRVDGPARGIGDDRVLAVEAEHHRLALRALQRPELHVPRLRRPELLEARAERTQERREVLEGRLQVVRRTPEGLSIPRTEVYWKRGGRTSSSNLSLPLSSKPAFPALRGSSGCPSSAPAPPGKTLTAYEASDRAVLASEEPCLPMRRTFL